MNEFEIRGFRASDFLCELTMAEPGKPEASEQMVVARWLSGAPDGPVFRWHWVWLPLLLLIAGTVATRMFDLDLRIQKAIFEAGDSSWALGSEPFWHTLYQFGTIPALILTIGSVVGYGLSWSRPKWKQWRRVLIFIILIAITGPGLVTNLTLKENWGRPRPREVEGLGGHNAFEPVLTVDRTSDGKSFPCGHATMGYLFMGGFFLLRRYRRGVAWSFLVGGFVGGTLTGIARMLQGGHFFSDVIWAAAICWFVPMGFYYALGLHRGLLKPVDLFETAPKWIKVISWSVAAVLFTAAMFATPFRSKPDFFIVNEAAKTGPLHVETLFVLGDIDIRGGDKLHIDGESYGHGVPTSKLATIYQEREKPNHWEVWYMERISGRVSEVNQQLTIEVPRERTRQIGLRTGEARIWLELFEPGESLEIHLYEGAGDLHLYGGSVEYQLIKPGEVIAPETKKAVTIIVHGAYEGRIIKEKKPGQDSARPATFQ